MLWTIANAEHQQWSDIICSHRRLLFNPPFLTSVPACTASVRCLTYRWQMSRGQGAQALSLQGGAGFVAMPLMPVCQQIGTRGGANELAKMTSLALVCFASLVSELCSSQQYFCASCSALCIVAVMASVSCPVQHRILLLARR
jgi:hypothetical protein